MNTIVTVYLLSTSMNHSFFATYKATERYRTGAPSCRDLCVFLPGGDDWMKHGNFPWNMISNKWVISGKSMGSKKINTHWELMGYFM